jgi:hypothetical protein
MEAKLKKALARNQGFVYTNVLIIVKAGIFACFMNMRMPTDSTRSR